MGALNFGAHQNHLQKHSKSAAFKFYTVIRRCPYFTQQLNVGRKRKYLLKPSCTFNVGIFVHGLVFISGNYGNSMDGQNTSVSVEADSDEEEDEDGENEKGVTEPEWHSTSNACRPATRDR